FTQFINNSFDEKFYLKNLGIEKKDPKHFTIRKNHACCLSFGFRG
ncbi:DNA methyltransferase, partial [Helicobacter pylori]